MKKLIDELKLLVAKENQVTLDILLLLNKLEEGIEYKELGYSSLFAYLTKGLKYSEPAANRRIRTARCISKYPEVKKMFQNKQVNLTTVSMFSSVLTPENKKELLGSVKNKTKTEVEAILSEYKPQFKVIERIKPVAVQKKVTKPVLKPKQNQLLSAIYSRCDGKPEIEKPVTEQRYELKFSVNKETMDKYEQVKSLLSSKYPTGLKIEDVFTEVLDSFLAKKAPKERKAKTSTKSNSRYIPKVVRDKVYLRDGGKCSFVAKDGTKCNSTWDLEIDHIEPYSLGGSNTEDNLRLLCRCHNHMRAKQTFS